MLENRINALILKPFMGKKCLPHTLDAILFGNENNATNNNTALDAQSLSTVFVSHKNN